jgi:tRNA (guanine-N7-)-methyltransferase
MSPPISPMPSARNCANHSRSACDVSDASPPPTITRSPSSLPPAIGPRAYAVVRQRYSAPSRSSAARVVTSLAVDAIANSCSELSVANAALASTRRMWKPMLSIGRPACASALPTTDGVVIGTVATSAGPVCGFGVEGPAPAPGYARATPPAPSDAKAMATKDACSGLIEGGRTCGVPQNPRQTTLGAGAPNAPPETRSRGARTMSTDPADVPPRRAVRSFVLRGGRMGSGQARALAELGPRLVVPLADAPLEPRQVFGRNAPLVVEVGFGMGQATAEIARTHADIDFLGIEVHVAGIGALLQRIGEAGLGNLRIVRHDAAEVFERMLAPDSLAGVNIFFPDPWPKKRHHKRRLVQGPFVALVASRLAPGGTLHCATDWQPYAEQMLAVLGAEPRLVNTAAGFAPRPPHRPVTKFERRGRSLGHGVWDLVFVRT